MEDGSYKKPEFDAHRSDNEVRVEGGGEKVRERERRGMFACVCERGRRGGRERRREVRGRTEISTEIHTEGGKGVFVCQTQNTHALTLRVRKVGATCTHAQLARLD